MKICRFSNHALGDNRIGIVEGDEVADVSAILEDLPGIGPSKRRALLKALGSLRAVRGAALRLLSTAPGISPKDRAWRRKPVVPAGFPYSPMSHSSPIEGNREDRARHASRTQ